MSIKTWIPNSLRSTLINCFFKADENPMIDFEFKIAQTRSEFEQAYKLLHDCYVGLGIYCNFDLRFTHGFTE